MGFGEIRMIGKQACPNCKGTNVAEIPWGYPSREFLERSVNENDDPFVKISAMIGGDDYLKVARSLVKMQHKTDGEISKSTGLRINLVRRVLYDLFGKGIIEGVRVKDEKKEWFVYRWRWRTSAPVYDSNGNVLKIENAMDPTEYRLYLENEIQISNQNKLDEDDTRKDDYAQAR